MKQYYGKCFRRAGLYGTDYMIAMGPSMDNPDFMTAAQFTLGRYGNFKVEFTYQVHLKDMNQYEEISKEEFDTAWILILSELKANGQIFAGSV